MVNYTTLKARLEVRHCPITSGSGALLGPGMLDERAIPQALAIPENGVSRILQRGPSDRRVTRAPAHELFPGKHSMHNTPQVGSNEPTWPGHTTPPQPWPLPNQAVPPATPRMRSMPPPYPQSPRGPSDAWCPSATAVARSVYGVVRLVPIALAIVEGLLFVRIVLLLLAANPAAGFSSWIYALTTPLVAPFYGVFPGASPGQGHVLDMTAILAMIVYAVVARVVGAVIRAVARP